MQRKNKKSSRLNGYGLSFNFSGNLSNFISRADWKITRCSLLRIFNFLMKIRFKFFLCYQRSDVIFSRLSFSLLKIGYARSDHSD